MREMQQLRQRATWELGGRVLIDMVLMARHTFSYYTSRLMAPEMAAYGE